MIRVGAKFEINQEKVKLMANCPNCWENVDLIEFVCLFIPSILKFIPTNKNENNGFELKVKCPKCEFKFTLNSAIYN